MAERSIPEQQATTGSRVGLNRNLGFWSALMFGVLCISLSSSGLLPFSTVAGLWPGANLSWILTVAMLFCMAHAFTYAVIGTLAPRSGADYVVASRTLGAPVAFVASWTFVIFSALVAGSLIASIPQNTLPTLFSTLASITGNNDLLQSGVYFSSSQGIVVVGTICIVLAYFGTIMNTRVLQRIFLVGMLLGLVAWGVIYYQLASATPASFSAAWDQYMGAGSFAERIDLAHSLGMKPSTAPGVASLAGLIMGFWIFYGYFIPTFSAGEVKHPENTLLSASLISLVFTWAVFVVATLLLQRLVTPEWLSAESFLYQNKYDGISMPWVTYYAAILKPNLALVVLVGVAWVYTLINLAQTYFFYVSRILLAWTKDALLPAELGYIHPNTRTPMLAVLLVAIVAELGVVDAALGGVVGSQFNFVFFAVISQSIPVLAMTIFPFIRPTWFASAPRLVRAKLGPIPVITLVGGITLAYFIWLIVSSFLYPVVAGPVKTSNLAVLMVCWVVGFVWYFVMTTRGQKKGVNFDEIFGTLEEHK